MSRFDVQHFECFLRVAEELHFGRAAARMGIGQPAVSLAVQRIEERLETKLFIRRPAVRLTPAGELLRMHLSRGVAAIHEGCAALEQLREGKLGQLRLGFPNWAAATPIPAIIARFRQTRPNVEIALLDLATADQIARLREGELDVAFVREPAISDELQAIPILTEPFVAALPASAAQARVEISLSDLLRQPLLLFPRERAPGFHDLITSFFDRADEPPVIIQKASDWLTILGLVRAGMGVAIVPRSISILKVPGVRYARLSDSEACSTVTAVTRKQPSFLTCALIETFVVRTPEEREPCSVSDT